MWRNWFCKHEWTAWGQTIQLHTVGYPTWVQFKQCTLCGKEKKRVV